MPGARKLAALALLFFVAACGRIIPQTHVPPVSETGPVSAIAAGVRPGPAISGLRFSNADASAALGSFRESCPKLLRRSDTSGLTRSDDWRPACDAASAWSGGNARDFFARYFETARISDGQAFVTGYFEPEIAGVRTRQRGFDVPIYGLPPDLVRARAGDAPALPSGRQPLGRYDAFGLFVPYFTRAEIEDGVLMSKGLEIAWAADPVDFFFLQVQGSGRLRALDGSVMRIGYAGQNGQPYTGIGAVMRERGLIGNGPGQYSGSMQGIKQYLREHPAEGRALMRENKSWVFFRDVSATNDLGGPVGALGVPVRAESSVAADPRFVPLGAPVWLDVAHGVADGLWIAQDTGGAIKGANRFDSFWGAGEDARRIAGGMSTRGDALLFLPTGTLKRLGVR